MGKETKKPVRRTFVVNSAGKRLKDSLLFQVGRVCVINYGPDVNKLCVILDFIDSNEALITGPHKITGVVRQSIPFKRLSMTPMKIKICVSQTDKTVARAMTEAGIWKKWLKHPWYLKNERKKKRLALTDFDRFKVMLLRQKKAQLIFRETLKLKEAIKNGPGTPSKKTLYWRAKRAGENPDYWRTKFRDPKHKILARRKRSRGRKRSTKISAEKMAAKKAFSAKRRSDCARGKHKMNKEQKLATRKKMPVRHKRKKKKGMVFRSDRAKAKKIRLEKLRAYRERKAAARAKSKEEFDAARKATQDPPAGDSKRRKQPTVNGEKISYRKAKKEKVDA